MNQIIELVSEYFPYWLIIFTLIFDLKYPRLYSSFYLLFFLAILIIDVGYDYQSYVSQLEGYKILSFSEFFPLIIFHLSKLIESNVFFFSSFVIIQFFLLKKIISDNIYGNIVLISFVLFPLFFLDSLSTIRQHTAILISLMILYQKDNVKKIITLALATMFHYSALSAILFIVIPKLNLKRKFLIFMAILSIIINQIISSSFLYDFVLFFDIFYDNRIGYILDNSIDHGSRMSLLLLIISILNILFYKKLINNSKFNSDLLALFSNGIFIINLLSFNSTISLRLSLQFIITLILIIPLYYRMVESRVFILALLIFLYFYQINAFSEAYFSGINDINPYIPYSTWIFK